MMLLSVQSTHRHEEEDVVGACDDVCVRSAKDQGATLSARASAPLSPVRPRVGGGGGSEHKAPRAAHRQASTAQPPQGRGSTKHQALIMSPNWPFCASKPPMRACVRPCISGDAPGQGRGRRCGGGGGGKPERTLPACWAQPGPGCRRLEAGSSAVPHAAPHPTPCYRLHCMGAAAARTRLVLQRVRHVGGIQCKVHINAPGRAVCEGRAGDVGVVWRSRHPPQTPHPGPHGRPHACGPIASQYQADASLGAHAALTRSTAPRSVAGAVGAGRQGRR